MTEALFPLDAALIADQARARGAHRPDVGSQWRLSEIQIANWGTFDSDIHRIPVSHQGHLITGPSGSGKSSLLDGIAAVLTPDKWLRFNVAAQTAGSRVDQRSLVSYVRGAWTRTADADEDRVVSKYLRPRATWSGIVLRYDNGTGRPPVPGPPLLHQGLEHEDRRPRRRLHPRTRRTRPRRPSAVRTHGTRDPQTQDRPA